MNVPIVLIYLQRLVILSTCNSFLFFWIFIELTTVIFLIILVFNFRSSLEREIKNQSFYYFIMQSCVSFIILAGILLLREARMLINLLISFCLVFKLGIFPFYIWVIKFSEFLDYTGFFLLIVPQKFYLLIVTFEILDELVFLCFWVSLYLGAYLLIRSWELKRLLIGSSISSTLFFYLIFSCSILNFLTLFLFYRVCFHLIVSILRSYSFIRRATFFLFSLVLLSSPFFFFFVFKFQRFYILACFNNSLLFVLFWVGMFARFVGYASYFFRYFIFSNYIYNSFFLPLRTLYLLILSGIFISFLS